MAQLDPGRGLISSYGLFWNTDDTEWVGQNGHKGKHRMLGRLGAKRSSLIVADFWSQTGIYVLYGNYGLYYVGIASRLGPRVRRHMFDRHADLWDRFSWFGFRRVRSHQAADGLHKLGESGAMT